MCVVTTEIIGEIIISCWFWEIA